MEIYATSATKISSDDKPTITKNHCGISHKININCNFLLLVYACLVLSEGLNINLADHNLSQTLFIQIVTKSGGLLLTPE